MQVDCKFYFEDLHSNRKKLFEDALRNGQIGKVLYILSDELEELPELSQDINPTNRHYMKMITFLYAKSLQSLIESLATLSDWQSIPRTIILDDLSSYCHQSSLHSACGVVALLIDSARSCSEALKEPCSVFISATRGIVDENYCNALKELYFDLYADA